MKQGILKCKLDIWCSDGSYNGPALGRGLSHLCTKTYVPANGRAARPGRAVPREESGEAAGSLPRPRPGACGGGGGVTRPTSQGYALSRRLRILESEKGREGERERERERERESERETKNKHVLTQPGTKKSGLDFLPPFCASKDHIEKQQRIQKGGGGVGGHHIFNKNVNLFFAAKNQSRLCSH